MKKRIISIILGISIIASAGIGLSQEVQASMISHNSALRTVNNEEKLRVRLDRDSRDTTPHRFRMSNKKIEGNNNTLDLRGLSELNISGSGQPTINGLKNMKELIPNDKNVLVLDLRQESHLLVNGEGVSQESSYVTKGQYAISWSNKNNSANEGKTGSEVVKDELNRKKQLYGMNSIKFGSVDNNDKLEYLSIDNITKVETEEELVKSVGYNYYRIPVTDGHRPTDKDVDTFIKLVKRLPSSTWIHFHCMAGKGRTTTFMCIYDMMKNAKDVSFDDIINRQILIGGYDKVITGTSEESQARAKFLKEFYWYCYNNTDDFETTWTQR